MNRGAGRLTLRGAIMGALLATAAGSRADFAFLPGPPQQVAAGPRSIASADFNGDGISDVVVSSAAAGKVSILFSYPTSESNAVREIPVGRFVRGLATADFNGDRLNDIAVADPYGRRVVVTYGSGVGGKNDGFFPWLRSYPVSQRGPLSLAVGNFDGSPGTDIVTANGQANTVSLLANAGGNRGFTVVDYPAATNPRVVIAIDANGDRLDDLLSLETGPRGLDQVSLHLNAGNGFASVTPRSWVVGFHAVSMATGDFNHDGRTDVVVVCGHGSADDRFPVTVLLGQDPPGFRVLPSWEAECPPYSSGIEVGCVPTSVAVADFDSDSFDDVMISFDFRALESGQSTAGFANGYIGRGDGLFRPESLTSLLPGPSAIYAGDVTGNAVADVVVLYPAANAVNVLHVGEAFPLYVGESCQRGEDCYSFHCVDGVCCATAVCPAGQSCDVPAPDSTAPDGVCRQCADGMCPSPTPTATPTPTPSSGGPGDPCSDPSQCRAPLLCNTEEGGLCCDKAVCPDSESCRRPGWEGLCSSYPPRKSVLGEACTTARECDSGNCAESVCCEVARCPPGSRCDITGFKGTCVDPLPALEACERASDCQPGLLCAGSPGSCLLPPTPTPTICLGTSCAGDCNQDRSVTVDELLVLVNIALGNAAPVNCAAGDSNGDGRLSVDEVVTAVGYALAGCGTRECSGSPIRG